MFEKTFHPKRVCLGFNFVDTLYFYEYNRHWYLRRGKHIYFALINETLKSCVFLYVLWYLIFAALTTQEVLEKDLKCVTHSNQTVVMSSIPVSLEVSYHGNTYFICSCIWMIIQVIQIYVCFGFNRMSISVKGYFYCWA